MLRWFLSRKVRQATNLCRHVQRLVNAQRDQLRAEAVEKIAAAVAAVRAALAFNADKRLLEERMADLEKATARWLKFHPHASVRENVEVILVAVAIAVAIHTFFLKPFKIPTGSMQPTLCGITADELGDNPDVEIPTGLKKFFDYWIYGISYSLYRQGDRVLKTRVFAGDHLFVDRLSYNFRRPKRGEIIVFKTEGIRSSFPPPMPQDQYYIKRMVAMGGEQVLVGNDRHLAINGRRLDHTAAHFENVYSFDPRQPPQENHYSGHLNGTIAARCGRFGLAPLFPDEKTVVTVRPGHYMVMGDNTLNSSDSRTWGDFSCTNVIGKYFFVYWPISSRFGWAAR